MLNRMYIKTSLLPVFTKRSEYRRANPFIRRRYFLSFHIPF